jgi:hypothetical protein
MLHFNEQVKTDIFCNGQQLKYLSQIKPSTFNPCWPLVPKIAGSLPVEAVGFFSGEKSSACLPSEGK